MGRVISLNYNKIFEYGIKFEEQAMQIKKVRDDFQTNFESVKESWSGVPANNFVTNSKQIIDKLNKEMIYLLLWSEFFTKASYKYSGNITEGLNRINRIKMMYEQEQSENKGLMI